VTTYDLRQDGERAPARRRKFPAAPYALASSYCGDYMRESAWAAKSIDMAQVDRAATLIVAAYARDASVFACGNGGSAAIANHLQCDHMKSVRVGTGLATRVASLSSNVELLTAAANDLGYENAFVYQLESQARTGDVLIAISSSGRSPNIVRALAWARDNGLRTIALTGFDGGAARAAAEVAVHVDCSNYGIVEDLHQAVLHGIAQYVRQSHMAADAIAGSTF
jgi:D-sedoheptulose 7-phosphate isomerase/D-glycero-D-manno-heptose 1,7-bisphosphate phosphatase